MEMPDWVDELKGAAAKLAETNKFDSIDFKDMEVVSDYSTFFAEFELAGDDILIHLFPRAGEEDVWTEGRYIDRCRACHREVPPLREGQKLQQCPHCRKTSGLIFVPGRRDEPIKGLVFPQSMRQHIEEAGQAWLGDAKLDYVEELHAYVIKFIGAATVEQPMVVLLKFLDTLDTLLDPQ